MECEHETEDFGNMRFKDIYEKMKEQGYNVRYSEFDNATKGYCKDCGSER
jgi:hypothetical protein